MEHRQIKSILVVDGESATCSVLQEFFLRLGYKCQSATDPFEALRLLDVNHFDLVISDVNMPKVSGMDLLRQTRLKHPGIEIIMMTGQANDFTYSEIIEAGAADFIRKPFELPVLLAKIERIARERKMSSDLKETYNALGVVLRRVEEDKEKLKADTMANLKRLFSPYLDKLKRTGLDETQRALVDIMEANLSEAVSSFTSSLPQAHLDLSHMEIQIANLIQIGKSNKEIAEILGLSINTIKTHRYHLRTKLGLKNEKVNLKSYLKSIE